MFGTLVGTGVFGTLVAGTAVAAGGSIGFLYGLLVAIGSSVAVGVSVGTSVSVGRTVMVSVGSAVGVSAGIGVAEFAGTNVIVGGILVGTGVIDGVSVAVACIVLVVVATGDAAIDGVCVLAFFSCVVPVAATTVRATAVLVAAASASVHSRQFARNNVKAGIYGPHSRFSRFVPKILYKILPHEVIIILIQTSSTIRLISYSMQNQVIAPCVV